MSVAKLMVSIMCSTVMSEVEMEVKHGDNDSDITRSITGWIYVNMQNNQRRCWSVMVVDLRGTYNHWLYTSWSLVMLDWL